MNRLAAKIADLGRTILKLQFSCSSYEDNVEANVEVIAA